MELKVVHSVELPFILNLPNDTYDTRVEFGGNSYQVGLQISNTKYKVMTTYRGKEAYMEVEEDEISTLSEKEQNNYREKLRTHISWDLKESKIYTKQELDSVSEEKRLSELTTSILMNKIDYEDDLEATTQKLYSTFTEEEKVELSYSFLINKELSRLTNADLFLEAINQLIKAYSVFRNDYFVEKCSYHTLRGVQITRFVDNVQWDDFKRIEKLPPMMNKPWLSDNTQDELTEFQNNLRAGTEIDPLQSLILVAKNLLEKSETRSAIINISAVLEYSVERKIRNKLLAKGKTERSIDRLLDKTKMNFRERCDKNLKNATGVSLVTNYPDEWRTVQFYRKKYRHSIAHSVFEPTPADTNKMILEFEKVIAIVESL
ncbi:hypothetical protein [Sporosarcina cyprini]|uniref:hypothetical protein n=1 Tax=Sporosarcina cyprini TaxID=2910523 RepID=UPI001EDFEC06|nr:hypothetical protein [Sporosarcina cyprini]MCG3088508.1 hypothetical protein [Sporosarcina cyprini]